MIFDKALVSELKGIASTQGCVYPLNAPEKVRKSGVPYIIYSSSAGVRTKSIGEGYSGGKQVSVEVNVVTGTYELMKAMTADVVTLLEDMECREIGTGGPYIQELTYFEPVEFYETEAQLYRCSIEFNVFFEEVE